MTCCHSSTQKPEFRADPEIVLVGGLEPATTPVVVTLKEPKKGFQIIDGKDPTHIYDVERKKLRGNRWEVHLFPCRLYVIGVPHKKGKNLREKTILLLDEKQHVSL